MLQVKQRMTYLPDQGMTIIEVGAAKLKLDDTASSPVAAPDACPVTAVVILSMEPSLYY